MSPSITTNLNRSEYLDKFKKIYKDSQYCYPEQVELLLDKEFEPKYTQILSNQDNHIIITINEKYGYGDIFFAIKLYETLKTLPNTNIALLPSNQKIINVIKSIINNQFNLPYYYPPEALPYEFKKNTNGLLIFPPTSNNIPASFFSPYIISNYNTLYIEEYGNFTYSKNRKTFNFFLNGVKSAGVSLSEYGIFIDTKLINIIKEDKLSKKDPLLHIQNLVDEELKTAIIPYNQAIEDYSKQTNLYFGYAHKISSQKKFIKLVASLEQKNHKNIDMILILDEPAPLLKSVFDEKTKEELKQKGFGSIELLGTEIINLSDNSKKLKIIPRKSILHKDFETCLLISEPLSLITGDQSLSEAISTNKIFVYELYHHKIPFMQSLQYLAEDLNLYLVYNYLINLGSLMNFNNLEKLQSKDELIIEEKISQYLINPNFISQWQQFINHIQKEKSLNDRIIPLICKILAIGTINDADIANIKK